MTPVADHKLGGRLDSGGETWEAGGGILEADCSRSELGGVWTQAKRLGRQAEEFWRQPGSGSSSYLLWTD